MQTAIHDDHSQVSPPRAAGRTSVLIVVLAVTCSSASRAWSIQDDIKAPPDPTVIKAANERRKSISDKIEKLIREADELDNLKDPKQPVHFERPHPELASWGADMSPDVLERMVKPISDNRHKDTYIRWHLMHVVQRARQSDRRKMGKKLIALIKGMPEPLAVKFKVEYRHVPPEVAAEYYRLRALTHVVVGYPPYQRDYRGEASLPFVEGDRKKQIEDAIKRMAELKFETVTFHENIRFNKRVRKINWMVRQYRGELIYALLQTGDPAMAKKVVNEIGRQTKSRQTVAFDLLSFMYLAAFDGVMDLYDAGTLREMSMALEGVARGANFYYIYRIGDDQPPGYYHMRTRNFADYAFHMIYMLRDIQGIAAPLPQSTSESMDQDEPPAEPGKPATPAKKGAGKS